MATTTLALVVAMIVGHFITMPILTMKPDTQNDFK